MEYSHLLVSTSDTHIGTITLNSPDTMNTFTTTMATELHHALTDLDADKNVRVILLKANGRSFSAGIDVNELEGKSANEYRQWIEHMERPLISISKLQKPVIAQLQGIAAANGMGLVASADLVIASEKSRMGLTAINVGLNCVGPVIPVARCVGRKKAMELLLYGNLIDAKEALDLGLINRIVSEDELESEALQWAEKLARKSPIAVQIAKTAFYNSEDMEYEKQFAYMNEAFARLCSTDDAKEGVNAFFAKRTPQWSER